MIPDFFKLDGKVAIVTGVQNPVSRAIALALAEAGADVVAVARDQTRADETAHDVADLGRKGVAVRAEIASPDAANQVVQRVISEMGQVDILVNGEQVAFAKPLEQCTLDEWRTVMDYNTTSMFLWTRAVSQHMLDRGKGRVINLSHGLGEASVANTAVFGASQAAVSHFTHSLGVEWAATGVTVNGIAIGWFEDTWEQPDPDPLLRFIPERRRGRPEEAGPAAVYLASDDAQYCMGQVMVIDGGQICHA